MFTVSLKVLNALVGLYVIIYVMEAGVVQLEKLKGEIME